MQARSQSGASSPGRSYATCTQLYCKVQKHREHCTRLVHCHPSSSVPGGNYLHLMAVCFSGMARRHVEIPPRFTTGTSGCQGMANSSSLKTSGGTHSTHTSDYNRPVTPLAWQGQDRVCSPYSPGSFSPQVPSPQLASVWGEWESEPVRASLACQTPVLLSTNQVFTDKSQPSIQIPIAQATITTIYKGFFCLFCTITE